MAHMQRISVDQDERQHPGRLGEIRGLAVSNARCRVVTDNSVTPRRWTPGEWGVRFGQRYYPDYATPDPTRWDGQHGGMFLTPEEADELAAHLTATAAWARAQNHLTDREKYGRHPAGSDR